MNDHYDLVVIGGGAAGLVTAGGAAQLGARTLLVERERLGGECLYTGCVPSKALLAAAEHGFAAAKAAVAKAITIIEPHDAPERFEGFGVEVLKGDAHFTSHDQLLIGQRMVTARRFVIATGSEAVIPPVPGLDALPVLTNESIWALESCPEHLLIVGGGAIGCEMAQAFRAMGAAVTILELATLLPNQDADAVDVLRRALVASGVAVREGVAITAAGPSSGGVCLTLSNGTRIEGSHVLLAAGRRARTLDLGLNAAGVEITPQGIKVDGHGRTANRRIFAAGDCRAGPRLTHAAELDARAIIQTALFPFPKKIDYKALPAVIYTSPEVAQVGVIAANAPSGAEVWRHDFDHNDRAVAEGDMAGFVKLVTKGNKVLGATIVGTNAGELLALCGMAVAGKLSLSDLANQTLSYPTRAEAVRFAAEQRGQARLFTPFMRRLTKLFQKLP
ncbi:FAD-dependent oxidoreductase [Sandarakinorhabdus sp.]|uniref:dihydrolipoyl dehydrogenase family protein n=1 Tax=Sandarakinorhabdus sp. TaxID=1916663 RepID=UPI00286E78CA|nr:FAD-dependent oxidoreductase [Sandarakinorhabdus sp.]